MACHAARVLRQRHKAEADMLESEISPEQRKCLESAFEAADKNGDGILSADEYYEIFQTHGLSIGKQNKIFLTSLFVSKYQINPLMYLAGNKFRLQCLSVYSHKFVWCRCPRR